MVIFDLFCHFVQKLAFSKEVFGGSSKILVDSSSFNFNCGSFTEAGTGPPGSGMFVGIPKQPYNGYNGIFEKLIFLAENVIFGHNCFLCRNLSWK